MVMPSASAHAVRGGHDAACAAGCVHAFHFAFGGCAAVAALHDLADMVGEFDVVGGFAVEEGHGHVAAGDEDRRNVKARGCHEVSGDDGVAGGEHDHAVEHVGFDDEFDFIGDAVAAGEFDVARVFENHAVADSGRHHLERESAGFADALFDALGEVAEMDMSGVVFVPGVDNGDDGTVEFLFGVSESADESAAAFAGDAVGSGAAFVEFAHEKISLFFVFVKHGVDSAVDGLSAVDGEGLTGDER